MANPYHDKEGKFTSREKEGTGFKDISQKIKLKTGVDLSNFPHAPFQPKPVNTGIVDTNFELTLPKNIDDARLQGNRILGSSSVVNYENETNLEQAFEMNKGLKAVASEFPKLFENNRLLGFGTQIRSDIHEFDFAKEKATIDAIYNKEEYNDLKSTLANAGIDFRTIRNAFIGIVQQSSKRYNFERDTATQGITSGRMAKLKRVDIDISSPDTVQINARNMRNDLQVSFAKINPTVRSGLFLPFGDKTPTFATVCHELGHHCHNQLMGLMNVGERTQLDSLTRGKAKLQSLGEISGYATTNRNEMIAEAFSDVMCRGDQATNHNKNIFKFFKGVYNRIYGNR